MSTFARDLETLEQLIDRQGIANILNMIAEIAVSKAAHIDENWQDWNLAASWRNLAKQQEQTASKLRNM